MIEIYNIFKEIERESSKTKKMEILKKNSDNNIFKIFLSFMYDDTITTGLSKKSIDNNICANEKYTEIELNSPLNVMEFIKENNTGSNQVIFSVQSYLNKLEDDDYSEWLKYVFAKEYKCGITANTINKIFPSLIHEFKVQLAFSFEKYEDKVEEYYLTQKLDGHRTLIHIDSKNDKITFRTRKGHQIFGLGEIENEIRENYLSKVITDVNFIFDGEVTVVSDDATDVFNATSKIITKKSDKQKVGLKFNWFDFIPYNEFLQGKSKEPYKNRRFAIDNMFENIFEHTPKFFVNVPVLYHGTDKTEIAKWSNWATKSGYEGIMLNTANGLYETKRTSGLLKIKKFKSADVKCVGVFEGTSKYSNMLGGITVDFCGNLVDCGTGFTDEQRNYYWKNKSEIIGEIVELKYFEESTNQKNESISLRFPVFQKIRSEKDEDDINIE